MNGAPCQRWDTTFSMSESETKPEPPATPWPTKAPKQSAVTWPPELDEDTWPRCEQDGADEE